MPIGFARTARWRHRPAPAAAAVVAVVAGLLTVAPTSASAGVRPPALQAGGADPAALAVTGAGLGARPSDDRERADADRHPPLPVRPLLPDGGQGRNGRRRRHSSERPLITPSARALGEVV